MDLAIRWVDGFHILDGMNLVTLCMMAVGNDPDFTQGVVQHHRVGCEFPQDPPWADDPLVDNCPPNSDRWDIWTYDLVTSTETNETQTDWQDEEDPSWHPKSPKNLIAFQVEDGGDDSYDVMTWYLGTSILTASPLAASASESERSPWWTNTGQQVIFTEGNNRFPPLTDISIIDAKGKNYLNLTNTPTDHDWFGRVRPKN